MYSLALADDHAMLRKALITSLENSGFQIVAEASNGRELIEKLSIPQSKDPDIILLDILMPEKNGFEVCEWVKQYKPLIRILILSMNDDEESILRMIKSGARGFISKDDEPSVLIKALNDVMKTGYYFSKSVSGKIIHDLQKQNNPDDFPSAISTLTIREMEFLQFNCSELTYKEIAGKMLVSPRTIENYRDTLFQKLNVKTRLGLALISIKKGWVKL